MERRVLPLLNLRARRAMGAATAAFCLGVLTAPACSAAQPAAGIDAAATPAQARKAQLDYGLKARSVGPGVWVVEGAVDDFSQDNGCNIINTGFIQTDAGALVINTGPSRLYGEQLRTLVQRTTSQGVAGVVHLNLHPDYFLGNQAFADVPRWATSSTAAGIQREAAAYETNMFRLCGDWMKGTESVMPNRDLDAPVKAGSWTLGGRVFDLVELKGHTDSDLVLIDRRSGVVFAGGLVFAQRVPTTPHADVPAWLNSLQQLRSHPAVAQALIVPSHGPVHRGTLGITQTTSFLQWLDTQFSRAAQEGWDMNELLRAPVPAPYRDWAAFRTEFVRNVAHLYPRYERAALTRSR